MSVVVLQPVPGDPSLNPLHYTPQAKGSVAEDGSPRPSSADVFTPRRSLSIVVAESFSSSVRGVENVHIYLWILKDLFWAQDAYWPALICGSAAVLYSFMLIGIAVCNRDAEETYMLIALSLWLCGNGWWMCGEVGISGDDDTNAPEAAYILVAALAWILLYHVLLRPLGLIRVSQSTIQKYKGTGLRPRFTYFVTWRGYEHAHSFFWAAKDLSWNRLEAVPWILFSIPTILIAIDFIWCTWKKGQHVDCLHYVAQLIWVLSNLTWAGGEIYNPSYDDPIPITTHTPTAYKTCRWWASNLLVCAFAPIALLYLVILPLKTCEAEDQRRRRNLSVTNTSDDGLLVDEPETLKAAGGESP